MQNKEKQVLIINTVVPNSAIKFLLNCIVIINLGWSKNQEVQLMGMSVATIVSNVFGYFLIISLNVGLAFEVGRKIKDHEKIGIYYQRALLINFLFCAFVITPLLYASKKMVIFFQHVDANMADVIGNYLFQLVPSIYCFAFFDTTQTFLQAQNHILAPLLIQTFAVFIHLFLISKFGAAWSRNFVDFSCCVALYVYINMLKKPLKSWIEWTIKCIKNWQDHIKFLELIGITTYLQAFFILLFSFEAYPLPRKSLICHLCYINLFQMTFLFFIGLKQGMLIKVGSMFKSNYFHKAREDAIMIIKYMALCAVILSLFMYLYVEEIADFFLHKEETKQQFKQNLWMLLIAVILDALQIGLMALLKAVNKNYSILKINCLIFVLILLLCYYFAYYRELGLYGLWMGWIFGLGFNTLYAVYMLFRQSYKFKIQFHQKLKTQKQIEKNDKNDKQIQLVQRQKQKRFISKKSIHS